ncbi:MAG: hypothetical protein M1819_001532 [Sarea resinae]|nr:MAG: hypothetical protein M1819_001532 [Sarea resinae]
MAFASGLNDRVDDMRFPNPQSPPNETTFPIYTSPFRGDNNHMQSHSPSANEIRANLQRRFTTDSAKLPTMNPMGRQHGQVAEPLDLSSSTFHKVQLLEKKQLEYEMLREQRRRFEAEMQLIDLQQKREEEELRQMARDLGRVNIHAGHQSEPTTPPEYRDSVFPSAFSRPNRFSVSSMTSPPGLSNRSARSGSQIASPPSDVFSVAQAHTISHKLPSKSMPGSRRNSDENEAEYATEVMNTDHRSAATMNRNSMPATGFNGRSRHDLPDLASVLSLGQINTTGFLFGDDDEKGSGKKEQNLTTSPDVKSYLQMNATDDKFPILVRRNDYPGLLSASSAALDLALSQSPGPESQANGWPSFARHRPGQHSLPLNTLNSRHSIGDNDGSTKAPQPGASVSDSLNGNGRLHRKSLEVKFSPFEDSKTPVQTATPPDRTPPHGPPKLQSSYSTNDIPTMKSTNGLGSLNGTPKTHAQQHFHNHNASLGRIPPNAVNNRHHRALSGSDSRQEERANNYQSIETGLQANAAPFGPPLSSPEPSAATTNSASPPGMTAYNPPPYYGGYGMQMLNASVNNPPLNQPMQFSSQIQSQMQMFQPQAAFAAYQGYSPYGRFGDSQARVIQQRRVQNGEGKLNQHNARFANLQLEHLRGEIYGLCKDQHGCRFLQKKLEERNAEHVHMIFLETNQHVVELMTDPFGNYLCQKLLEYANDDERTVLINNAAPQMVKIALNQHGTRALQKMIEFISTPEQIQTIICALQDRVVELIQDLNGNHVIQKCLNRLSSEDAQFIFDAVGANCVVVGTHRHGCCVLQRCIDHASGNQKAQLIRQISGNSFALVQDPFGNYVVQYILDLGEPSFSEPLWHGFLGSIPALSKQKFSSNVIEKCLRTADHNTKQLMIEEMLNPNELEKMLRDSFANYVVQTAMDYADPETKSRLVESIRPILPAIRSTPYGRRIQGKIQDRDGRLSGSSSGQITPNDASSPGQIPLARNAGSTFQARPVSVQTQNEFQNTNGNFSQYASQGYGQSNGGIASPTPASSNPQAAHLNNIPSAPNSTKLPAQNGAQQNFSYGRAPQPGGFKYF